MSKKDHFANKEGYERITVKNVDFYKGHSLPGRYHSLFGNSNSEGSRISQNEVEIELVKKLSNVATK